MTLFKFNSILKFFIIYGYWYQSGYYSYLIRVGLGLAEGAKGSFALFNLSFLGCQSLWENFLHTELQYWVKRIAKVFMIYFRQINFS